MPGALIIQESNIENQLPKPLTIHLQKVIFVDPAADAGTTSDGDIETVTLPPKSEIPPPHIVSGVQVLSLDRPDFVNRSDFSGAILRPDIPDGEKVVVEKGALVTFISKQNEEIHAFFLDNKGNERNIKFQF